MQRGSYARFIASRIIWTIFGVWLVSILVFVLLEVLPGSPARVILGQFATAEGVRQLEEELNLDRPASARYVDWITGVVQGDFGQSLAYRAPVSEVLSGRVVNTITLAVAVALIAIPLGVFLGTMAGARAGGRLDRVISAASVTAISQPEYLIGIVLLSIFAVHLGMLPVASLVPEGEWAVLRPEILILPALTIAIGMSGYLARVTRASVADVMAQRWIRTARLKGLSESNVIRHHALRNALAPTMTVVALYGGWLLGGVVIVESLFAYPGIGYLMYQAVLNRDLPVIAAGVLIVAIGRFVFSLLTDIGYSLLDPRVTYR